MTPTLSGHTAVVAVGIPGAEALARRLAREGAGVVLVGTDPTEGGRLAAELHAGERPVAVFDARGRSGRRRRARRPRGVDRRAGPRGIGGAGVKPVIGISAYPRVVQTSIGPTLLHTASRHYVESVERAGGLPVVLPVIDPDVLPALLGAVHTVLLTGGGDVQPARYGSKPIEQTRGVDPARDDFEIRLLEVALERDLPVLATCRGMQLLNVALGGSFIQHVPDATGQDHDRVDVFRAPVHRVKIEPDSHLAAALGRTEVEVNSIHHQAVDEPAPRTRAVAWAEDGTVEAIEIPGSPHVVSVQWHPELLEDLPEHQGLFRQLVDHARARM